jgi:methionyl-tRNA formyltransferase
MALIEALVLIALGRAETREQDESRATWAPRVTREDARVNWELGADEVARALRAYDPRPGAFTTARGSEVQLFGARIDAAAGGAPGQVLDVSEEGMLVACGRGAVRILQVHPPGRKRMSSADWFKGRGVAPGDVLGTTG